MPTKHIQHVVENYHGSLLPQQQSGTSVYENREKRNILVLIYNISRHAQEKLD